jgi:ceramide glucosyltransferase
LHLLIYISALLTLTAIGFYVANLFALRSWTRQKAPPAADTPVSILKPLKGCDPEMYECFRSHCEQGYSAPYEIIFGVNDASDEAGPFVEKLKREYPQHDISLVVCTEVLGANRKVSNLAQMAQRAKYPHLLVNDSDIDVEPDYLSRVMRWFAEPKVGLVTCLYRAEPARGLWSRMEALGVLADFMPGALTARMVERGAHFGLGSTLAISRTALESIGGFEKLTDYLADDYELANHVVRAGYDVALADNVVETRLHDYTFRGFWEHQIRWGRTVRSSRRGGHFSLIITYGLVWALIWVAVSRASIESIAVLIVAVVTRFAVAFAYARALEDWETLRAWRWLPLRDLITPVVWLFSVFGSTVAWRGEQFRLHRGKLEKV